MNPRLEMLPTFGYSWYRVLADGRAMAIYPLLFERARLVFPLDDVGCYGRAW